MFRSGGESADFSSFYPMTPGKRKKVVEDLIVSTDRVVRVKRWIREVYHLLDEGTNIPGLGFLA